MRLNKENGEDMEMVRSALSHADKAEKSTVMVGWPARAAASLRCAGYVVYQNITRVC